jgi:hypothetical protein
MSRDDTRFWIFVLVLCFLFSGEPDVWDCLRASAGVKVEGCSK